MPSIRPVRPVVALLIAASMTTLAGPTQATAGAASTAEGTGTPRRTAEADFNGDGFADHAVGVFEESVGAVDQAGAVNLFYGSPSGLQATGSGAPNDQLWTQDSVGILDKSETGDGMGASLEAADYNGDGFADLAIAARAENVGTVVAAGAVNVLYGSSAGLTAAGDQYWTQNSPSVKDTADTGDHLGSSLTDGDFNGDGYDDLAIGVDFEGFGDLTKAGAVNVLYGGPAGLQATGVDGLPDDQLWTQNSPSVKEKAEENDRFGRELEGDDYNGDGYDDLAIGTHFESAGPVQNAGTVNLLYGGPSGLQATGVDGPDDQLWAQGINGVKDQGEIDDRFGSALGAGDFNLDGFGDLAVGIRLEDLDTHTNAGAVSILHGSAAGIQATGVGGPDDQLWIQDALAAPPGEGSESDDWFGYSLSSDDYDGDGFSDLTAGARFEDVGPVVDAGAVNVLYGSSEGLSSVGNQYFDQNSGLVGEGAETGDNFAVWSDGGDFDGDGADDLAVAVWIEDVGPVVDAGAVNVLYGTVGGGLTTAGDQYWHQDVPGVLEEAEFDDEFGWNNAAT
jgi:hypothetical protein